MVRALNLSTRLVSFFFWLAVAAIVFSQYAVSAHARANVLSEETKGNLEQNAAALNNIEVEWVQKRSSSFPLDQLLRLLDFPANKKEFLEPRRSLIKIQDNRLYGFYTTFASQVDKNRNFKALVKVEREAAYDGTTVYSGNRKTSPKDDAFLNIWSLDAVTKTDGSTRFFDVDYLYQAGFKIAENPIDLNIEPRSLVLDLIAHGARLLEVETTDLDKQRVLRVVLQHENQSTIFYLDPGRRDAILSRQELTKDGTLLSRAMMEEFEVLKGQNEVWLPHKCKVDYYAWPSIPARKPDEQPLLDDSYNVTLLKRRQIPSEEFRLDDKPSYTQPGTEIGDARLSKSHMERVVYRIPINPGDLDEVIKAAIEGRPINTSRKPIFLILANLVLVVVLVLIIWYRRRFVVQEQ